MLTNGLALYHDSAQPHMTEATTEKIQKLKSELSAYSPDFTPSDYYNFRPLKDVTWMPICK
jgi:hypothetical protein